MEDKFSIFVPFEIEKAGPGEDRYKNMRIKGIASTLDRDTDDEILDPNGFDVSSFKAVGLLNYHHLVSKEPLAIIGEPTKAEIRDNQLYVEGMLYPSSQKARDVYDITEILQRDSSTRRMGFSIEGNAIERDPKNKKKILKANITHLAITPAPKNKGTKCEIMKGGFDDIKYEAENENDFLIDVTYENMRYTVDKDLNICKAMVASSVTGTETHNQSMTQEPLKEESVQGVDKKKKKKKLFSKSECISEIISMFNLHDVDSVKRVYTIVEKIQSELEPNMAITKEALEKAEIALGLRKAETTTTVTISAEDRAKADRIQKAKDDLAELDKKSADLKAILEGKEPAAEVTQTQSAAIAAGNTEAILKAVEEKFASLGVVLQAKGEENDELRKSVETLTGKISGMEKQALGRKSTIATQSFKERFTNEALQKAETEGQKILRLSDNQERGLIAETLFQAAMDSAKDNNGRFDETLVKAVTCVEGTRALGRNDAETMRIHNFLQTKHKITVIR